MEPATFHLFTQLPPEVRACIFRLALPSLTLDFTVESSGTVLTCALVLCPVRHPLSGACVESRKVASDYGLIDGNPNPAFFMNNQSRPHTRPDECLVRLANSKPKGVKDSSLSPSVDILTAAKQTNIPVTVINPEYRSTMWQNGVDAETKWKTMEERLYKAFEEGHERWSQNADYYRLAVPITLHGKKGRTLEPGLFGEYGQNPVQIVSARDTARIDLFYHMWKSSDERDRDERAWPVFECLSHELRFTMWLRNMARAAHDYSETRLVMSLVNRWAIEAEQGRGAPGQGEAASRALAAYEAGPGDDGTLLSSALEDALLSLSECRENYQAPWSAELDSLMPIGVGEVAVVFQACYKGRCFSPTGGRKYGPGCEVGNLRM